MIKGTSKKTEHENQVHRANTGIFSNEIRTRRILKIILTLISILILILMLKLTLK